MDSARVENVSGNDTEHVSFWLYRTGGSNVTIKDIARMSGVSITTVSRVLNNRPDVSDDVRRKVLSAIKASNYIPNNSARDLVRTKSDAIGLVVRGVSNPFYTEIIQAIESTVTDAGFTLVMQQIGACDDEVKRAAVMEREKRLRGIVFLGGRFDYTPADLALLNIPFVCCSFSNRYGTLIEGEYSSVSIADGDTARQAVEELYRHGHRQIAALISRPDDQSISQLRYEGYCKALTDAGITPDDALVICTDTFNIQAAYQAMNRALDSGMDFTAVFAISDNMAIGAMRALREHGRTVPDDCSVIAIDGIEVSDYIDPPLTTLCQPMEKMGQRSMEILLDMIEGRAGNCHEVLPTVLRIGGSVKKLV